MRENRTYGSAGGAELLRPDPDRRFFGGVLEILCQSFKVLKKGLNNDREIRF